MFSNSNVFIFAMNSVPEVENVTRLGVRISLMTSVVSFTITHTVEVAPPKLIMLVNNTIINTAPKKIHHYPYSSFR